MPVVAYRGVISRFVYRFLYGPQVPVPAALSDPFGNPTTQIATWNGEQVVPANNDGSVARSVIGGPPAGDPYSFTVMPSPWESSARPLNQLTLNQASIETDASGWLDFQAMVGFPASCTLARTSAQALDGTSSLRITGTGGIVRPEVSTAPLVFLGGRYVSGGVLAAGGYASTMMAFLRSATTSRPVWVTLLFVDAAGNVLAQQDGVQVSTVTNAWTRCSLSLVAPANTARAIGVVNLASVPAGEVHYLDCALLGPGVQTTWVSP